MRYLKIFGLAAIAAAALMAFAGSASATILTSPECKANATTKACEAGMVIKASSEGHTVLDSSILGNVECNSTVAITTSSEGSSTTTVSGAINFGGLTFTNCTSAVVQVISYGTIEVHTEGSTANNNGTLTSTGAEWTVEKAGFHCIYSTNNTDIGKITGSTTTRTTATIDINATVPRTGGRSGMFCGASAPWTGSYKINSPDWLDVD